MGIGTKWWKKIENFKKAIDYGKLNNVEVKITINRDK